MATTILVPDSDISENGWGTWSFPDYYDDVDEGIVPNTVDYIDCANTIVNNVEFGFTNVPAGAIITKLDYYIYAENAVGAPTLTCKPFIEGGYLATQVYDFAAGGPYMWVNKSWNGVWTEADVNAMQFHLFATNIVAAQIRVATVYCQITYTPLRPFDNVINNIGLIDWGTATVPNLGDWVDDSGADCNISIVAEIEGHKNVLRLFDGRNGAAACCYYYFTLVTVGTIKFYMRGTDVTKLGQIVFYDNGVPNYCTYIRINGDKLQYRANGGAIINIMDVVDNTWYLIEFIFDCVAFTFTLYVDNVLKIADIPFFTNTANVVRIYLETDNVPTGYSHYFDNITFSWKKYTHVNNVALVDITAWNNVS